MEPQIKLDRNSDHSFQYKTPIPMRLGFFASFTIYWRLFMALNRQIMVTFCIVAALE